MNKKKLMTAVTGIMLAVPAFAQYSEYNGRPAYSYRDDHKIYYGLRLGLSLSTINSDEGRLDGGSVQAGLNLVAVIGFQLGPSSPMYLESGLFDTEKGGKGRFEGKKMTYDMNYIELPVLIKYKYEVYDDLSLQPLVGGYLAVGVGGKVKDHHLQQASSSFSSDNFKRFDAGLRIGCGFEYNMAYMEMAYDFGLANLAHSDFDSSHNGCFYINCGVNF